MTDDNISSQTKQRPAHIPTDGYLRFQTFKITTPDRQWTLRVGFDRDYRVGDRLVLIDTQNRIFALGTIDTVLKTTAESLTDFPLKGYKPIQNTDQLISHIEPYYPSTEIDESTVITGIKLTGIITDTDQIVGQIDSPAIVRTQPSDTPSESNQADQ